MKKNFCQKGFSLVELLVAISIFVILTTAVIVNLRGGSPLQELNLQSNNLISVLKQAKAQSTLGQPFEGQFPTGGYGVLISTCSTPPCSVTLFADQNSDFQISPGEAVEESDFGNNVTIDAISAGSPLQVLFKPPRSIVCINGLCSGSDQVTITLGSDNSSETKSIRINPASGLISQ